MLVALHFHWAWESSIDHWPTDFLSLFCLQPCQPCVFFGALNLPLLLCWVFARHPLPRQVGRDHSEASAWACGYLGGIWREQVVMERTPQAALKLSTCSSKLTPPLFLGMHPHSNSFRKLCGRLTVVDSRSILKAMPGTSMDSNWSTWLEGFSLQGVSVWQVA